MSICMAAVFNVVQLLVPNSVDTSKLKTIDSFVELAKVFRSEEGPVLN
jgi:hypothetical protein